MICKHRDVFKQRYTMKTNVSVHKHAATLYNKAARRHERRSSEEASFTDTSGLFKLKAENLLCLILKEAALSS